MSCNRISALADGIARPRANLRRFGSTPSVLMGLDIDATFGLERPSDLMGRPILGGGTTFVAEGSRFAMQSASTVVLA